MEQNIWVTCYKNYFVMNTIERITKLHYYKLPIALVTEDFHRKWILFDVEKNLVELLLDESSTVNRSIINTRRSWKLKAERNIKIWEKN